jgi:zinc protease
MKIIHSIRTQGWRSACLLSLTLLTHNTFAQALTTEYQLNNGMKVIVREDHRAPTVAHMVWYNAGSLDEVNGQTGVAHVLEHMMFKGTHQVPAGAFSRQVAALGGRENAFTSKDYTAYFQQIEKRHLPKVMALEADRMQNLNLSAEEFSKEIQVVMEERRLRTEDQARALVYEQLLATAFIANPYRRPIIGWMNDLEAMKVEDARDWYQRWYVPNNATLVVVGDVETQQVIQWAREAFEPIPSRSLPERRPQIEPIQRGLREIVVKAPAENPYLVMAWRTPRFDHDPSNRRDVLALELLAGILDGHDNARLNRRLVRDQHLAHQVGASFDGVGRGPQLFMLDGSPVKGQTPAKLRDALKAQIHDIAEKGITENELARVKAQLRAAQIYKRDSVLGQAMEIGAGEITGTPWQDETQRHTELMAITPAQIQAVAKKYFSDDGLTVAVLDPQPLSHSTPRKTAVDGGRHH